MLIVILVSVLLISFLFHINFIVKYAVQRLNSYYKGFVYTAISNALLALTLIYIAFKRPEQVQHLDMKILTWIMSGVLMLMLFLLKISIFKRIYNRAQDPQHFHYNFFGKKVLHSSAVSPIEIVLFFASMPFFLFSGAYFVARVLNLILYNHI